MFYTISAISTLIGNNAASTLVSIALFFFAFTTIMAYYYYAETNLIYLFSRFRRWQLTRLKHKEQNQEKVELAEDAMDRADQNFGDDASEKVVVWVLRICTITAVFGGSITTSGVSWTIGDIGVGAMAWMNLVAILLLSPTALRALRDYEKAKKLVEEPPFDPKSMDIQGAEFWETFKKE